MKRPENDEIVECESCGRMLYYEEPPAPPAPAAEVAASAAKQDASSE